MLNRIPPLLKNKYFLVGMFFLVWMLFFDENSWLNHNSLNKEQNELELNKTYFEDKISTENQELDKIQSNPEFIEKYAREKYLMKKENEDLFIVVEEDSTTLSLGYKQKPIETDKTHD